MHADAEEGKTTVRRMDRRINRVPMQLVDVDEGYFVGGRGRESG